MNRLVRVNELGLVIPPQRLDCPGQECPVANSTGSCFVDEHHLYFPRIKFKQDPLRWEFREHPFNRFRLPRCQHNSAWRGAVHSRYAGAPVPSREVMTEFLKEAELLRQLGVLSVKSDGLLASIEKEAVPVSVLRRREEAWYETQETFQALQQRANATCEVVRPFLHGRREDLPQALGALLLNAA